MSMDYRPHLLVAGVTGARVNIPRGYTSEQWEDLQKRFVNMVYPRTSQRKDWALWLNGSYALYEDQQRYGVYWHEELAGPRGMSFTLLIMPEIEEEAVKRVKDHLRSQRDVVSMSTIRLRRMRQIDP